MQTKKGSIVEACTNTAIGFILNFSLNASVLPLLGVTGMTSGVNITYGLLMTVVSVARGYTLRRMFNLFRNYEVSHNV